MEARRPNNKKNDLYFNSLYTNRDYFQQTDKYPNRINLNQI